ncbi:MAG: hypothetical protein IPP91_12455 [Betaproteobacteria bacterium]|nr:hypothetical protein [Betaproteobacteria bacterium]
MRPSSSAHASRRRPARSRLRTCIPWIVLAPALWSGASSIALAQQAPEATRDARIAADSVSGADKREGRARFFDPEDQQLDLSYFLENPRGFLPIPIIVTEPAVGYGGGGVGMFLRPRKEAGEEGWSRPDISAAGALATQNGTRGAFGGDTSLWFDGRLKTVAGAGTGRVNLDFYGLGFDRASLDRQVRYSLDFTGAVAQANWQLAPRSPWSLGFRYVYADVDPKLRDEAVFPGLANSIRVKVSAPTAIVEFDTRDNVFTPTRGVYAESSYLASRQALGASDDFERFQQVLMGWQPLARKVTLGARGNYAWASEGTPFFLRPFVQLRGVPAMRYQGDRMATAEAEVRWQLEGRWSLVAFGGAGTTRTNRDTFTATQNVGSGGVGFRYELARKFGMHAGIDVAHSPGTTAVYFQIGNSWFRP